MASRAGVETINQPGAIGRFTDQHRERPGGHAVKAISGHLQVHLHLKHLALDCRGTGDLHLCHGADVHHARPLDALPLGREICQPLARPPLSGQACPGGEVVVGINYPRLKNARTAGREDVVCLPSPAVWMASLQILRF